MTTVKQSAVQILEEAEEQLTLAVNALDMAQALLKDIDLHNYISVKSWGRWVSLKDAVNIADSLLRDLQNAVCPDCGTTLKGNTECLENNCPFVAGGKQ